MARNRQCFVYVFACYPDAPSQKVLDPNDVLWRKVGVATNPANRLSGVQTGNPFPVRLEYCLKCKDTATARAIEAVCHAVLGRRYEQRREWFRASNADIVAVVRKAGDHAGADLTGEFCWYRWQDQHFDELGPYIYDLHRPTAIELDPSGLRSFALATKN